MKNSEMFSGLFLTGSRKGTMMGKNGEKEIFSRYTEGEHTNRREQDGKISG